MEVHSYFHPTMVITLNNITNGQLRNTLNVFSVHIRHVLILLIKFKEITPSYCLAVKSPFYCRFLSVHLIAHFQCSGIFLFLLCFKDLRFLTFSFDLTLFLTFLFFTLIHIHGFSDHIYADNSRTFIYRDCTSLCLSSHACTHTHTHTHTPLLVLILPSVFFH